MTPPPHMPIPSMITVFPSINPLPFWDNRIKVQRLSIVFMLMEVALELEDDLLFADLSKQISLLIMDEDDDPLACSSPTPYSLETYSHPPPQPAFLYEQALIRQRKGTGVFIPQSTQPRRKHRKGRSNSNIKYQKQSQDKITVSQVPIKTSCKPKNT
ncbi:hypothetical protein VNO78_22583 [Psophocarpus tetragonolobus]|uniref:Uncharacterized protein n=1 Tax=Psophocarpus tetragonolobus TaxID=3891 RepID=A0AAN9S389_PSOTE